MKFRLQSLNDVVTNSSMEVYQEATQYTVDAVKDIINVILKIGGSDKSCDDLFTVSIDYSDMLEDYFERCIDNEDIDEEYRGMIEEVRNRKDEDGHYISDWRYPTTQVSIIPKNSDKKSDAAILNKINDLFCVEACYN